MPRKNNLAPKLIWALAVVVWALGMAGVVYAGVLAIVAPDSDIVIESAQGYTGVLEPDDLLVVVKYDIPYASLPTESATAAYFALFSATAAVVNSSEIFGFNDKGYNTGILSFYWTAAQRSTDSVEHDNPNSEAYQVTVLGKSGVFPGAIPTQTSTTITWRVRGDLRQNIIDLALELDRDAAWTANNQDLIKPGDAILFTDNGSEYFATVIPRLATMESTLFTSAVQSAPPATRVAAQAYSEDLNDYWNGTWVETNTTRIAANQGVEPIVIRSLIAMIMMMIIVFIVAMAVRPTPKANEFGLMTLTVTAPLAGAINFLALPIVIVMGLLGVTGIAWAIWGRKG